MADGTTNVGYGLAVSAAEHSRAHLERRLAELECGAISGIPVQDAIARARDAVR
jgi:hypothetical protein